MSVWDFYPYLYNTFMVKLHVKVIGHVQGVFYRQSTKEMAERLNLSGWVRNCLDGSVEAVFYGAVADIDLMHDWLHHGPPNARVDSITILSQKDCTKYEEGFTILIE